MTLRQIVVNTVFALAGLPLACAQQREGTEKDPSSTRKITAEYLLKHGFKQSATDSDRYERKHARVGDLARELGFSLETLYRPSNPGGFESQRTVKIGDYVFDLRAEFRDSNGNISYESDSGTAPEVLDDPDAICTISVLLRPPGHRPTRELLKTDGSPGLRIKSVVVPQDRSAPFSVEFELSATGTKPVAIAQSDFWITLRGPGITPGLGFTPSFPEGTPRTIVVWPGKPDVFTLRVPVDQVGRLVSGQYSVRLIISEIKVRPQSYDYEWNGRGHHSDDFTFVIE